MRFLKSACSYQITSFAVLPERRFCVPATESHRSVACSAFWRHGEVISRSDGYSVFKEQKGAVA